MRYGENPHQSAAFYVGPESRPGVATARQLQGKELSYNNINDTDAAYELVAEFDPERVRRRGDHQARQPLRRRDRREPVGSLREGAGLRSGLGLRRHRRRSTGTLDAAAARKIVEIFTEVIIAPEVDDEALAIVAAKKNLRLLIAGALPDPRAPTLSVRSVAGGLLVQDRDNGVLDEAALKVVTKRAPTAAELADLALRLARLQARQVERDRLRQGRRHRRRRRRPDVARRFLAHRRAQGRGRGARRGPAEPLTKGSVVASDAFFPFADGLVAAVEAGATAVIQPGGSMRDAEVIAAADAAGIAMVFTGMRHFRH